jgi:hypothetical protein
MTRYACRVDGPHAEIRDTLRALGFSVLDLASVGRGCPDLLVCSRWTEPVLVEVKTRTGKLRATQEAFRATWPGQYVVLRSRDEAVEWANQRRAA